jgi:hypothetical protein
MIIVVIVIVECEYLNGDGVTGCSVGERVGGSAAVDVEEARETIIDVGGEAVPGGMFGGGGGEE